MDKTAIDVRAPDVRGGTVYGRVLMASLFVVSGLLKVIHFSSVLNMLADSGLPFAPALSVLSVLVELGGGLALAFGWRVRWAALALAIFVVPVTLTFHAFWLSHSENYTNQLNHFLKNIAIFGGLFMIAFPDSVARCLGGDSVEKNRRRGL
jgi:putative oxidoreductase